MKAKWMGTIVAAGLLVPAAVLVGQVDPNASNGMQGNLNPQSIQQNMVPGNVAPNPSTQSATQPNSTGSLQEPNSMRDSLGAPGLTGQQMLDQRFLRRTAEVGIADIQLGQLAMQKGSPSVKALGERMVDDHTALNRKIAEMADSMGVMLPKKMNREDQAEYDKLSELSGKEFDTEYVTHTARTHWQELHSFHMEASAAADPGLREQVAKAFITMHDHMGMIAKAADDEGIQLPPRPRRGLPPPNEAKQ